MLKLTLRSSRGFTFMDSLLDIMALSFVLPLGAMFYLYSMHVLTDMDSSATEFRLFSLELQGYLEGSEQVQIMRAGEGVRIYQSGVVYDIELYGTVVRKRKDQLGHEIMLTEVAVGKFSIEENTLTVYAEFKSGNVEEVEYALRIP